MKNLVQVSPAPNVSGPATDSYQSQTLPRQSRRSSVTDKHRHVRSTLWTRQFFDLGRTIVAGYNKLQVSHRGMYSIERLQAFQAYCEKTSIVRAVAVCVVSPLPSLMVILLIECIPLSDPMLGWKTNYMFWFRFFISGVVIIVGSTYQVIDMVDCVRISMIQSLAMSIVAMSVYVATVMVVAYLWVFPVPFGIVAGIGPCFVVFCVVLILTIGPKAFGTNPRLGHELKLQFYVLATEAIIAVIYPAFSSVYLRTSSNYRAGLVVLLPFIKLTMKNVVAWASSHVEDCIPVVAVFSIEVFNALYVATCMQATKSTLATVVIIGIDALNGLLAFHSLLGRTRVLQDQQERSQLFNDERSSGELIPTIVSTSQHLRTFKTKKGRLIQIRSPMNHSVGPEIERLLDSLVGHHKIFMTQGQRKPVKIDRQTLCAFPKTDSTHKPSRIGPFESHRFLLKQLTTQELSHEEQNLELVESTLQLLFHCEYHALVEYVECAVPILFGIYLSILCQLPVHKYYPHTRDMVPGQLEKMLTSLSVYVALEVASFVVMHIALYRKFKLSALYQLAFVLETNVIHLQSRLFVWIVFVLQFTLLHYGVDFTFRFAWVT